MSFFHISKCNSLNTRQSHAVERRSKAMSPIVESEHDLDIMDIDNDPQHDDQIAPTQKATPPYTRTSFLSFLSSSDIPLFRARYNIVCPRFVAPQFTPRYVLLSVLILFHNSSTLEPVASSSVDNNPRTRSASSSPLVHPLLISVTAPSPNPHKRDQPDTGHSPGPSNPPPCIYFLLFTYFTSLFFFTELRAPKTRSKAATIPPPANDDDELELEDVRARPFKRKPSGTHLQLTSQD